MRFARRPTSYWLRQHIWLGLLTVPLVGRGQVFGVVTVGNSSARPPLGAEDVAMLEDLGRRAGAAVDTAQDLAVDVAVVQGVVRRALADREHRREVRDAAAHAVPIR